MKLVIVLYSNHLEPVYQAFQLGSLSLKKGDEVIVFLMARGIEGDQLDYPELKINDQIREFLDRGGKIYSFMRCMKMRNKEATEACPMASMEDLHQTMMESDNVVSF